jgi:hypothetical protein
VLTSPTATQRRRALEGDRAGDNSRLHLGPDTVDTGGGHSAGDGRLQRAFVVIVNDSERSFRAGVAGEGVCLARTLRSEV